MLRKESYSFTVSPWFGEQGSLELATPKGERCQRGQAAVGAHGSAELCEPGLRVTWVLVDIRGLWLRGRLKSPGAPFRLLDARH